MTLAKIKDTMDLDLVALNLLYMARDKRERGKADNLIRAHIAAFEAAFHLGARSVMYSSRELVADALREAVYRCDCAMLDLVECEDDRRNLSRLMADLESHRAMNRAHMDHIRDDGKEPYEAEQEDDNAD